MAKNKQIKEAQRLLKTIFGSIMKRPEPTYIALWCFPSKKTYFINDIRAAAVRAIELSESGQNVYFGLGAHGKPQPHGGRGTAKDVIAINCVWADIDYEDEQAHKPKPSGKKLPPNEAAALELVNDLDLEPSMVIHSGHGLQAYWIFKTPILITDDRSRFKASDLTSGWIAAVRNHAEKRGWTVDAVGDLSRVFRVPGTMNCKAEPVETKILSPAEGEKPRLYGREEIKRYIIAPATDISTPAMPKTSQQQIEVEAVTPRENPDIIRRIKLLCEVSDKLKKTWERKRTDLVDASASAYDMALANALVAAGAEDQEIADAIMQWRKLHDEQPEKALRRDYLMRTIGKAKTAFGTSVAADQLEKAQDEMVHVHEGDEQEDIEKKQEHNRQVMIEKLGDIFCIPLKRIIEQGNENATWSLVLEDGTDIYLGETALAQKQNHVRGRIWEATGVPFNPMNPLTWNNVLRAMGSVREIEENLEGSRDVIIMKWIHKICDRKDLEHNPETQLSTGGPFVKEFNKGHMKGQRMLVVQSDNLLKYINTNSGSKMARSELHHMLKLVGFTPYSMSMRSRGKVIHRHTWIASAEILKKFSEEA